MSKTFDYVSEQLETMSELEKAKKELINSMCEFFGVKREDIRLQQGMITLYGCMKMNGEKSKPIPLTSRITDFRKYVSNDNYMNFNLKTRMQSE